MGLTPPLIYSLSWHAATITLNLARARLPYPDRMILLFWFLTDFSSEGQSLVGQLSLRRKSIRLVVPIKLFSDINICGSDTDRNAEEKLVPPSLF